MKILHVVPIETQRPTGPSKSIICLANALASLSHEVGIVPSLPLGGKISQPIDSRVHFIVGPRTRSINPWGRSDEWIKLIEERFCIPDFVDFHGTYVPFHISLASVFLKSKWKYVVTPRGGVQEESQKIKFFKKHLGNKLFFNRYMRNASAIHALTTNERANILKIFPEAKVFVSPNGCDEELHIFRSLNRLQNGDVLDRKNFHIGFLGRLSVRHKGLDLLLSAIKRVETKIDYSLSLIGPFHTKNDEKYINKMISNLISPQRVKLFGALKSPDKYKVLSKCDLFVHVSRFEGMPNAVLEAMMMGLPVLVTPGSNMQNIVSVSNGGWLCDLSVDSIAENILDASRDLKECIIRGYNARNYINTELSWENAARQYVDELSKT